MTTLEHPGYLKTSEEYLAAERIAEQRHEYLAGSVYAMAGTSRDHERIAINICGELRAQLRGRPCEVLASNIKVRIGKEAKHFFYYPDATVDCGSAAGDSLFAEQPRVIFEILSPETERIDRVEKLYNYQTLPSLSVYVLVDQLRLAVTVYRRKNAEWTVELLTKKDDILKLPEIGCALPMTSIYERTHLVR
jgi:Uma2 family endonuclease